jgi:hypothetical protein
VAWAGREGSFGPDAIATNGAGFRDRRPDARGSDTAPRIALAGASYTFGLGVGDYDALFHVRLEKLLRESGRFPPDLEILNMSQTGYHFDQVRRLIEIELDRMRPDAVLIALNRQDRFLAHADETVPEFRDGLRLYPGRAFPGGFVDVLRTRTWTVMRAETSPILSPAAAMQDQLLARAFRRARTDSSADDIDRSIADLQALRDRLAERGIPLACVMIYRPGEPDEAVSDRIRAAGIPVVDVHSRLAWTLSGDGHWNEAGHANAAKLVAEALPAWDAWREDPVVGSREERAAAAHEDREPKAGG